MVIDVVKMVKQIVKIPPQQVWINLSGRVSAPLKHNQRDEQKAIWLMLPPPRGSPCCKLIENLECHSFWTFYSVNFFRKNFSWCDVFTLLEVLLPSQILQRNRVRWACNTNESDEVKEYSFRSTIVDVVLQTLVGTTASFTCCSLFRVFSHMNTAHWLFSFFLSFLMSCVSPGNEGGVVKPSWNSQNLQHSDVHFEPRAQ